ncbi:MAG: endonuclease MutS2 [Anaerolineaceae bacterium]|nr:endonuclease MutS2 [Anaerolineaceae bacterium]
MDNKTLAVLEFPRVLDQVAKHASFSVAQELVQHLRPIDNAGEIQQRQQRTREARLLINTHDDIGVGGARDIRDLVGRARRNGVLDSSDLLEISSTLVSARTLMRRMEKVILEVQELRKISMRLLPPSGIIDAISAAISDRGEVLDTASVKLAEIRREMKRANERLLSKINGIISGQQTASMLQETIVTQRNGRLVVPLRAEFKGQLKGIIHDQSASGQTLFVEPLVVVEANNKLAELQLAERDEVRRILSELSLKVGQQASQIEQIVVDLGTFDFYMACARYAEQTNAAEPLIAGKSERAILLYEARHPLLPPEKVVPLDIDLDPQTFMMVITGPNTGGKTVTLKTVGLMVCMAQSGLHIPALSGSTLPIFKNVFADIGDEQSIEQSLSTFSGHITNIVRILKKANTQSLVLLDELGAGTDPQEGAALAQALLAYLVSHKISAFVATHYPELKTYAHMTDGVVNASMEFNMHSLKPTFHLTQGLPGRSNALLIAERLGLPEEILIEARSGISPDELRTEDLLDEINRQRQLARKARNKAERERQKATKLRQQLSRRMDEIEEERVKTLEEARHEAQEMLENMQVELKQTRRALSKARKPLEVVEPLTKNIQQLEKKVEKPVERHEAPKVRRPLKVGHKVVVSSLNLEAEVTALGQEEIEVMAGALRMRVALTDIRRKNDSEENLEPIEGNVHINTEAAAYTGGLKSVFVSSPGIELDLRGKTADEALEALEGYLDQAYLSALPSVRIIHGKGSGKLRTEVRGALRRSQYVKSWKIGLDTEGGDGVTVAYLEAG